MIQLNTTLILNNKIREVVEAMASITKSTKSRVVVVILDPTKGMVTYITTMTIPIILPIRLVAPS